MRLILKLAIALITAAAPCPAGAQFTSPEVLYQDPNWQLTTSHDQRDRTCLVAAREQAVAGPPTGIFMVYVANMASFKVQIIRIELMGPPREYLASGQSTSVAIDLGPAFRRQLRFQPLLGMFPTIATELAAEDLDIIRVALQPSGREFGVRFGNGVAWRYPPPRSGELAAKAAACWQKAGAIARARSSSCAHLCQHDEDAPLEWRAPIRPVNNADRS